MNRLLRPSSRMVVSARETLSQPGQAPCRHSRSGTAGGTFGIAVHTGHDLVVLAVLDQGGPSVPRLHQAQDHELNGRGLHPVEQLTTRWGVHGDGHGRTVWALLRLTPESPTTSARTTRHTRR
ncbi:ATP-binding protein [Nonomuraea sp. C10]|nr:ATP-binding protein [Nonomuraea sp. C10]